PWYAAAAAVASTRVYVRLHHASDVVAGAALGFALGAAVKRCVGENHGATRAFAVSFDYRCPFARNAHESVVAGLRAGRDWDVTFTTFSLDQVHVGEDELPVWEREPDAWGTGVNALLWGIAVRDAFSDR